MFKSYLKIASRNLRRQKINSVINIIGLSVGIGCFVILSLFVQDELSFDRFHEKSERMVRLLSRDTSEVDPPYSWGMTREVSDILVQQMPEVEEIFQIGSSPGKIVTVDDRRFITDNLYLVDPGFFSAVDFPVVEGNFDGKDFGPGDVMLSRETAERLFGHNERYVGRKLSVTELHEFVVKAVYELPDNTVFDFDYIISSQNLKKAYAHLLKYFPKANHDQMMATGIAGFHTYIVLNEQINVDFAKLEKKIDETLKDSWGGNISTLEPLSEVYFSELAKPGFGRAGNKSYSQLFLLIAVAILLIGIVNYMNMSTANYARRAKEVGVRKTVGGSRLSIMSHFFMESMLTTAIAMVGAICLIESLLPFFNSFLNRSLGINYFSLGNLSLIIGVVLVIGVLAGIYPALLLSKFKTVDALKGKLAKGRGGMVFRQFLVSFQFIVCIGLFAVTLIVSTQFDFLTRFDKGFETDQLLNIELKDKSFKQSYHSFKSELMRIKGVESVTGTTHKLTSNTFNLWTAAEDQEEDVLIALVNVEASFLDDLNLNLIEGLNFNTPENIQGTRKVIVNETAVKQFKWEEPLGKGVLGAKDNHQLQVMGVVSDFSFYSPKKELIPLMLIPSEGNFSQAILKLKEGSNIQETIAAVGEVFATFSNEYPFEYSFIDQDFAAKLEKEQRLSTIFGFFSVLAVFIAALGLFGLSIYMVQQKLQEIGIRKVLGASVRSILWLLNNAITRLVLVSGIIATPIVFWSMDQWLAEFPNHIELNAVHFVAPMFAMLLLSLLTTAYETIRSAMANPVNALRSE